ncbi:MAG: sigma-54 dependent transcriptional regulator [Chromatiales bacterium]|jgi:two-component system response regulator PilR (NtrC family)
MKQAECLIVDDEPDIRELLELTLSRMDVSTSSAGTIQQAHEILDQQHFGLCLTDMRLPDGDGIDLIRYINEKYPETPVAMITAHGNMKSAVEALKAGAFDFVSKPVDLKILRGLVETALKLNHAPDSTDSQSKQCEVALNNQLLGKSKAIEAIRALTVKLARNQAPIHISGESGTGKELAARLIHCQGPRADKPFVAVNCGAVPQELMESEFFGHVKGSFTGAIQDKTGLFQAADGGTLFLDEVADLPLNMQVKLLRAIQEKSIRPIGSTTEISIDVRLVSATHKNLQQLVSDDLFRKDLFYRLNVIELNIPPLREHREDIPLLIDHILSRIAADYNIPKPRLDRKPLKQLCEYNYPGNVRELENILEGAIALHENNIIVSEDLKLNRHVEAATSLDSGTLEQRLENYEKRIILEALQRNRWNRNETAKSLGISNRQLRYRMDKLELDSEEEPEQ